MHNAVAILVGLFVGGLYYQVNLTIGGFQSRIGSLFFLGSLLAFSSLSALSNFVQVKELFLRERAGGYYSPVAWFGARVVWDIIPLRIVPTVLVSCIV
jgi:ABC-type multidrug transport system permease subunit